MKTAHWPALFGLLLLASHAGANPSAGPVAGPPSPKLILPLPGSAAGMVTTDQAAYAAGAPVQVRFTVRNATKSTLRYEFPNAERYNVAVQDASGNRIWQWSTGQMFAQAVGSMTLKPGETKTYDVTWSGVADGGGRVPPGTYTVVGWLTSSSRPAITGGFAINTNADPTNSGLPTPPMDSGSVRSYDTAPPVYASAKITIR